MKRFNFKLLYFLVIIMVLLCLALGFSLAVYKNNILVIATIGILLSLLNMTVIVAILKYNKVLKSN